MANIYQKAIDEFNKHVEPDLSQAGTVEIPSKLSELEDDATHRTVTDLEKAAWNEKAANQPDSIATDAAGLVTDFNALLTKLKAAGIMEADAE